MRKQPPGDFQALLLVAIERLGKQAYTAALWRELNQALNRPCDLAQVSFAIKRLEIRGFIFSYVGGIEHIRGGRRKRYCRLIPKGEEALNEIKNKTERPINDLPQAGDVTNADLNPTRSRQLRLPGTTIRSPV